MRKEKFKNNQKKATEGKENTFVVRIRHCKNGTWQGKIIWAEENRSRRFRSTLELIMLMDETMREMRQQTVELRKLGS